MRSLLIGFFAGILISALRAPLGLELLQVPANAAGAAMAYRAAALLVVAVGLILGLRSTNEQISSTQVLLGAALGYQLHWQLVDTPEPFLAQVVLSLLLVILLIAGHQGGSDERPNRLRIVILFIAALAGWLMMNKGFPKGHGDSILVALCALVALVIVGRLTGKPATVESAEEPKDTARGSLIGIAFVGAGCALLAEGLSRPLRLLGGGLPADDSVFGSVFLAFAVFGAVAFGKSLRKSKWRLFAFGIYAAMSGVSAWAGYRVLENLSTRHGLDIYLRGVSSRLKDLWPSLQLDLSRHGMFDYDIFVAAPVLVAVAFFCGALIAMLRRPLELAAILIGGAAGLASVPQLLAFEWTSAQEFAQSSSAGVTALGGTLAAIGALVTFLTATSMGRIPRLTGSLLALVGIVLFQLSPPAAVQVLSPWMKREVVPVVVHEIPEGLITIEPHRGGNTIATLDRRPLTFAGAEAGDDIRRIQLAWSLLGEVEEGERPAVLFVGQLDVGRALTLVDLGAGIIDRTAAWSSAMGMIEQHLFEGAPKWFPGEILPLAAARAKLERGQYDLVIVAAVAGPAPTTRNLASPPNTTAVVWLDAGLGIQDEFLGESVLLSAPNLTQLFVGVARGPELAGVRLQAGIGAPGFLSAGEPSADVPIMTLLDIRIHQRADLHRRRFAERLKRAERTPGLAAGLALHFDAQVPSSPFLTPAASVELVDAAAEFFSQAAAVAEPDALAQELIEALAYLYSEQRSIEEIDQFLAGPAARHEPWPALEIALAQAGLEFLEPADALVNLARAHSAFGGTPSSLAMQAEAQSQSGDDSGAVRSLELALKLIPHQPELERRLAIALRRCGDARGPQAIEHALEHQPQDAQLLAHRGEGPYPAPPNGYHPLPVSAQAHDH